MIPHLPPCTKFLSPYLHPLCTYLGRTSRGAQWTPSRLCNRPPCPSGHTVHVSPRKSFFLLAWMALSPLLPLHRSTDFRFLDVAPSPLFLGPVWTRSRRSGKGRYARGEGIHGDYTDDDDSMMIRWYSAEAEGFLFSIDLLPSRFFIPSSPFFISCLSIYEYVILREGEKCYSILCHVHTWSYNFDVFSIFVDEEIWKVEINKQWISGVEGQARRNPVPFPIISRWEQGQIDR